MSIDTSPEIRELEDGRIGYFYSPQQLEEIRDRQEKQMDYKEFIAKLGHNKSCSIARFMS